MTRQQIVDKLKSIFALVLKRDADPKLIVDESRIREDFGISSVGMLYLMISMEEAFDINMDDVATEALVTLGDVITFVEQNLPK